MTPIRVLAGLLIAVASLNAHAERAQHFGDYEIHYNAIPTALLQPAVAQRYDILRSRERALLTASVLHEGTPVPASIGATAENTAGQVREVRLREIQENGAIYYMGTVSLSPPERLDLTLRVQPEGTEKTYNIAFRQRFYTEE